MNISSETCKFYILSDLLHKIKFKTSFLKMFFTSTDRYGSVQDIVLIKENHHARQGSDSLVIQGSESDGVLEPLLDLLELVKSNSRMRCSTI